jgi:hypothetical protein
MCSGRGGWVAMFGLRGSYVWLGGTHMWLGGGGVAMCGGGGGGAGSHAAAP